MDKRFERRLEAAKNPRTRRHNEKRAKKSVRPSSHTAAVLGEILDGMTDGGGHIYDPNPHVMAKNGFDAAVAPVAAAHHLAMAAAMDGVEAVKRRMGKKERMRKLKKRRSYYASEAAKRQEQREAVRAAMPEPLHGCPASGELAEAYLRRRESEEWQLRFGTLMIDLEENARREYAIAGNKFTGSSGGVKDWLKANCPLLAKHYSTCQRYKRLAQDHSDSCT